MISTILKNHYFHLFLIGLLFVPPVEAKRLHKEKEYQQVWCSHESGEIEVRLPDKTRIDCLTGQYAIEFDFATKWAEAIGQSLHYASQTGKQPGIVLILEKESDRKYLDILNNVIKYFSLEIKVWTTTPKNLAKKKISPPP